MDTVDFGVQSMHLGDYLSLDMAAVRRLHI